MKFEGIDNEPDIEKVRTKAREMAVRITALEAEVEILLGRLGRLVNELATAQNRDRQQVLNFEIKRLNEQIAAKNKELFGSSRSERRKPRTADQEQSKEGKEKKEKKKQTGHGPTEQPNLPLETETHKLDEADQICPNCEGALPLPEFKDQTEDSVQITMVERRVIMVLHKKQKYRCTCCGHIEAALGPEPLLPGGLYSPEFAVGVAVDKYTDHLPLERQVDRFERIGLVVTSQTLWDMLVALYTLLLPSYLALHKRLLEEDVLGADESPWRLMGTGNSKKWWVWALTGKDAVFYNLAATRGKAGARQLLQEFDGVLMADGYGVYKALEKDGLSPQESLLALLAAQEAAGDGGEKVASFPIPRYTLAGCWMHARRGLIQAEKNHPAASGALDLIAELYRIEGQAEEEAGGDAGRLLERRKVLRNTASREVIRKLRAWADEQRPAPGLKLEQAIGYLNNQWTWLVRFLEDPRIPLDNGASERAMRGPVLGRKNHYGSRSELGTRVAALFYTLCETCDLLEVDPSAYLLAATLGAKANPGAVLLPHTFAAEQAAKAEVDAAEAAAGATTP